MHKRRDIALSPKRFRVAGSAHARSKAPFSRSVAEPCSAGVLPPGQRDYKSEGDRQCRREQRAHEDQGSGIVGRSDYDPELGSQDCKSIGGVLVLCVRRGGWRTGVLILVIPAVGDR